MAGSVATTTPTSWQVDIDFTEPGVAVKRAFDGELPFARRLLRGEPDFLVTGRMDTSAETLTAINLSSRGVTFPAGSQRVIEVELHASGDTVATESGYIHKREMIVGGTTPVLGIVIGAIDTNMAGAVGGFTTTDILVDFVLSGNDVTVRLTNEGAAEINNFVLKVFVGKLQPLKLGV